jgi:hypothetical protein
MKEPLVKLPIPTSTPPKVSQPTRERRSPSISRPTALGFQEVEVLEAMGIGQREELAQLRLQVNDEVTLSRQLESRIAEMQVQLDSILETAAPRSRTRSRIPIPAKSAHSRGPSATRHVIVFPKSRIPISRSRQASAFKTEQPHISGVKRAKTESSTPFQTSPAKKQTPNPTTQMPAGRTPGSSIKFGSIAVSSESALKAKQVSDSLSSSGVWENYYSSSNPKVVDDFSDCEELGSREFFEVYIPTRKTSKTRLSINQKKRKVSQKPSIFAQLDWNLNKSAPASSTSTRPAGGLPWDNDVEEFDYDNLELRASGMHILLTFIVASPSHAGFDKGSIDDGIFGFIPSLILHGGPGIIQKVSHAKPSDHEIFDLETFYPTHWFALPASFCSPAPKSNPVNPGSTKMIFSQNPAGSKIQDAAKSLDSKTPRPQTARGRPGKART